MYGLTHWKVNHCLHVYVLSCLPLCLTCLQLLWLMNNNNGMTLVHHSIFLTPKYIYMYEDGQVGLFHHKFLNAYQHEIIIQLSNEIIIQLYLFRHTVNSLISDSPKCITKWLHLIKIDSKFNLPYFQGTLRSLQPYSWISGNPDIQETMDEIMTETKLDDEAFHLECINKRFS